MRYLLATATKIRQPRYDSFNNPGTYYRGRPLAGRAVSVSIPKDQRAFVGLIYDQSKFREDGAYRIGRMDAKARFVACPDADFNNGVSQFDGGLVVAGQRCFSLDFSLETGKRIRRRIPVKGDCAS